MSDANRLLSVIEQQIVKLGTEWCAMADARFWNEADARAYLLWLYILAQGVEKTLFLFYIII